MPVHTQQIAFGLHFFAGNLPDAAGGFEQDAGAGQPSLGLHQLRDIERANFPA
jgi:hypothetical protein